MQMEQAKQAELLRQKQKKDREDKMQEMLDKMGETVNYGAEKQMQMRQDQEYIKSCIQKDQDDHKKIQLEKLNAKRKHLEMLRHLDGQVKEQALKVQLEREE